MKSSDGMETLSQALVRLAASGYKQDFVARPNGQMQDSAHQSYDAHEFLVEEVARFEGTTDVEDESAVYALRHTSGLRGTLVVVFGPNIPTEELEVVEKLQNQQRPNRF